VKVKVEGQRYNFNYGYLVPHVPSSTVVTYTLFIAVCYKLTNI